MFKTIFTLAVIALVSNTDAAKLTHKSSAVIKTRVNYNSKLAQVKSKAKAFNKAMQAQDQEQDHELDHEHDGEHHHEHDGEHHHEHDGEHHHEHDGEHEHDHEHDLPESITLEEAEDMLAMADFDESGDVVLGELKKAC
jgi:hypothetical protein